MPLFALEIKKTLIKGIRRSTAEKQPYYLLSALSHGVQRLKVDNARASGVKIFCKTTLKLTHKLTASLVAQVIVMLLPNGFMPTPDLPILEPRYEKDFNRYI